jgi:prepilin-type processing-associated H-X9-DG protein
VTSRRFSLTDLAMLSSCGLVAVSILITQVTRHRAAARQSGCAHNLKLIGLGFHNYHSAYKMLPMGSGGTYGGNLQHPLVGNASRLSPWVSLSPFLEQQRIWEQIANPLRTREFTFPPMGPVPWFDPKSYTPWGQRAAIFVCPGDEDADRFATAASYVVNYGDGIFDVGAPVAPEFDPARYGDDPPPRMDLDQYSDEQAAKRGMFMRARFLKFRDILDGLSNTLMVTESRIGGRKVAKEVDGLPLNPSLCLAAQKDPAAKFWPDGRGACWADGSLRSTGFQTILPPNSPSATSAKGELEGVMSASSTHAGGVHVLFADGKVMFITDTIDSGDNTAPSVAMPRDDQRRFTRAGSKSPYGLWGALGTRASKEIIENLEESVVESPVELTSRAIAELQKIPLQTWTMADGKTTLEARQIDLESEKRVMLMSEPGDVKRIPLSSLNSEDAYRAVQQHLERSLKSRQDLANQLGQAVEMLEKKQFSEFVETFFDKEADQRVLTVIQQQRGILIYQLESTLRAMQDPTQPTNIQIDRAGDRVQVRFRSSVPMGTLNFERSGSRWLFAK